MQSVDELVARMEHGEALDRGDIIRIILYIRTLKSQRDDLNNLVHHRNQEILRLQELAK